MVTWMRVPIAIALAAVITFALFWVMQALVSVAGELGEEGGRLSVEFVRLRRDTTPEVKKREPPKREKPEQPPPPPQMNMAQNLAPADAVGAIEPMVDTGMELEQATSLGVGGADREEVPLVRVDPTYPPRAKQRGIGGYVVVQFTITAAGTVIDPIIVESKPSQIFDRAVLQAVKKWRYNPRIEGGQAVARTSQVLLRFDPRRG